MDVDNVDFMSPSAFCQLALKENLGGYGKNVFEEFTAEELQNKQIKKSTKKAGGRERMNTVK